MFCLYFFVQKHRCHCAEFVGRFRRAIFALPAFRAKCINFRMPVQIIFQARSDNRALHDDMHAGRHIPFDFRIKQRIVSASKHDRIDFRILRKQFVNIFLNEIIRAIAIRLSTLHQRHPHRACLPVSDKIRIHFPYLQWIASALNRACRPQHANLARARQMAYLLHRRANHAKHTPPRIYLRQIPLLYGSLCFRRSSVAGQNN